MMEVINEFSGSVIITYSIGRSHMPTERIEYGTFYYQVLCTYSPCTTVAGGIQKREKTMINYFFA